MEALDSCSVLVGNHQQRISISLALGREPGKDDCELILILNRSTNISTIRYSAHIRQWIFQVIDIKTSDE